ncbi:hypothetical protein Pcinc_033068 [Petrolisthes cinctipes]|uniref:Uncharacterized protein n=1 Tax=Petrolisthes cinctipes TaxID=88211 RepID=A0AAE1ESV1_PETCI|nr:hypothetical protein Pcinc_033068 [Petrolisthes cinctipes]
MPFTPLGPSTILMSNHPHSWAQSPHLQTEVFHHHPEPSPTITVQEPTAMLMPTATTLGPITTPCFITTTPLDSITIHTCNTTSVHSHFTN